MSRLDKYEIGTKVAGLSAGHWICGAYAGGSFRTAKDGSILFTHYIAHDNLGYVRTEVTECVPVEEYSGEAPLENVYSELPEDFDPYRLPYGA